MNLLVFLVQEATGRDGLAQGSGLLVLGLQLHERIAELDGERANAAMPLLLSVTFVALQQPALVNFIVAISTGGFVGPNPPGIATHIRETNRVGVQEGSLAPPAVLNHLLGLLVVEL